MGSIFIIQGILIYIYAFDHNPPHIHVRYAGTRTSISIENHVVHGSLPKRLQKIVIKWMDEHHDELVENWNRLKRMQDPYPVEPFEK